MTPITASLTWRVLISTAASYINLLEEADPDTLARWAGVYGTEDIKKWAREKVSEILSTANELKSQFGHDTDLLTSAQNAARQHVARLERASFRC